MTEHGAEWDDPDDRDLVAAEYVLGVLAPNQARALEALALNDAGVAASVAGWEARLAPLAELVEPIAPPAVLWRRLALATGIESVIQPVATVRPPVGRWRAATGVMTAVAAGLAFLLVSMSAWGPAKGPEPLMAALSPSGAPGAMFLVRVGADGTATVVAVGSAVVPDGRSLELWALAKGATAPVSMGLLPLTGSVRLTVPAQAGTELLVSQEPAGGSVTKQPTGPVVYAGQLAGI